MSTPDTYLCVCSGVRLTNDYKHTIWFASTTEQLNYFASKRSFSYTGLSFHKKNFDIKVEASYASARTWTYAYIYNVSDNKKKRYYYFINDVEYISESTVKLYLELDLLQTYMFDYNLSECFVEREHSATDEIGDNLLDEGLDVGELVTLSKHNIIMQDLCVVLLSSLDLTEGYVNAYPDNTFDGVYSGLNVYAVNMSDVTELAKTLRGADSVGKSEGIVSMWVYPKRLLTFANDEATIKTVTGASSFTEYFKRNETLDGDYTPRNNKLFCYPYNFLYLTNNAGGACTYEYERFELPGNIGLRVYGTLSPEASTKVFPLNYKGVVLNYDEGMIGGDYPTCAWNADVYKLWLAQTANSRQAAQTNAVIKGGVGMVGGVAAAVGGGITGNVGAFAGGLATAVTSGLSTFTEINSQLAQEKDRAVQPAQSKGSYCSSINIAAEHQCFSVMAKCLDKQHAQAIDDFFSLYGYKCLRVKQPNRKVRENWTYTKTAGCHAYGNIGTSELVKIQAIYDNGVTFWVNGDKIGDYSLTNNPL